MTKIRLVPRILQTLLAGLLLTAAFAVSAEVTKVDGDELQKLLDEGMQIVDVRRPEEWEQTGVVDGSHLLTFFDKKGNYDVEKWLADLHQVIDKDEPFVLICAVGGRTATISKFLDKRLGYANVHDAAGGIRRWIKSGKPVVEAELP